MRSISKSKTLKDGAYYEEHHFCKACKAKFILLISVEDLVKSFNRCDAERAVFRLDVAMHRVRCVLNNIGEYIGKS